MYEAYKLLLLFKAGARVWLKGLLSSRELNGQRATILARPDNVGKSIHSQALVSLTLSVVL